MKHLNFQRSEHYLYHLIKNNPSLRDDINNVQTFEEFKAIYLKYFSYRFVSHKGKILTLALPRYYHDRLIPRIKVVYKRWVNRKTFEYDGGFYTFDVLSKRISRLHLKVLKYGHEVKESFVSRLVKVSSYIIDRSSKFVRFKDYYLRVLFEKKLCELFGLSAEVLAQYDAFEMDKLYKSYMLLSVKERLRRPCQNTYYSLTRAIFD